MTVILYMVMRLKILHAIALRKGEAIGLFLRKEDTSPKNSSFFLDLPCSGLPTWTCARYIPALRQGIDLDKVRKQKFFQITLWIRQT